MPKVRAFEISPLGSEAQSSLLSLGQQIATARKVRGATQRDMARQIGISPQTMLFIEQGRPNVQIGHYARALSALEAQALSPETFRHQDGSIPKAPVTPAYATQPSERLAAARRHLALVQQPLVTYASNLEFAYDWSNPQMTDETLIRKVVEKRRFHDLAVICKKFGLDEVRRIADDKIKTSPSLRRAFDNIEQGFTQAHAQTTAPSA